MIRVLDRVKKKKKKKRERKSTNTTRTKICANRQSILILSQAHFCDSTDVLIHIFKMSVVRDLSLCVTLIAMSTICVTSLKCQPSPGPNPHGEVTADISDYLRHLYLFADLQ